MKLNLIGQKFGKLLVLERVKAPHGKSFHKARCECGVEIIGQTANIQRNQRGCRFCSAKFASDAALAGNTKHNLYKSAEYQTWVDMLGRCRNPKNPRYFQYGGRGIKVCKRWTKFENFYQDMGERPETMSLDRIDNNEGYYKTNCRWVSMKAQARNRSTNIWVVINGQRLCLTDAFKETKISYYHYAKQKKQSGFTPQQAFDHLLAE